MNLSTDSYPLSLRRRGITLEELADILLEHGAIFAINMDGGGSSTMVMPSSSKSKAKSRFKSNATTATATSDNYDFDFDYEYEYDYAVINRPTCLDLPFPICQRPVATVLCVSSN